MHHRHVWSGLLLAAGLLAAAAVPACQGIPRAYERVAGKQVAGEYNGLSDKSLAIVIYADPATLAEYPAAAQEVSAFLAGQFRRKMPTVKLLDFNHVIRWQNETYDWHHLQEKEIGKHFGVERVLYIELLQYSTREPGSADLLRGRIDAVAKIFETDTTGNREIWQERFNTAWPETMPLDITRSNDLAVRKRVLEEFSDKLTNRFYDHREVEKSVREKIE